MAETFITRDERLCRHCGYPTSSNLAEHFDLTTPVADQHARARCVDCPLDGPYVKEQCDREHGYFRPFTPAELAGVR